MTVVAAPDRAPDPRPRRTEPTAPSPRQEVTARQIRESSLMLAGRLLSLVVTFLTQVLTVRALSKSDYGAFAYALSVVLLLQWIVPLGLDRADTRFLAIYDERRDYPRLFGVLALETAVVTSLGAVAIAAVLGLRGLLAETLVSNSQAVALLAVMIGLAPLQALDVMVVNVFAVFAKPWSVFLRRYVLEPGLRFVVVAALVLGHRSVHFLATGYLVAGLVGVGLYGALLVRLLARQGLLQHFSLRRIVVPVREVLSFSLPLLLTNVVAVGATELAVVVLGHYRPTAAVAEFRAVQPFAAMNLVVMYSFTTLFTPVAARLFARGDRAGIRDLYWQTAAWIAVLTFPVLALTTAFARPLTVALLGARYADAANYLALLSVGCYLNAALGFNGLTVQILGRVRYVVVTTVARWCSCSVRTCCSCRGWGRWARSSRSSPPARCTTCSSRPGSVSAPASASSTAATPAPTSASG